MLITTNLRSSKNAGSVTVIVPQLCPFISLYNMQAGHHLCAMDTFPNYYLRRKQSSLTGCLTHLEIL